MPDIIVFHLIILLYRHQSFKQPSPRQRGKNKRSVRKLNILNLSTENKITNLHQNEDNFQELTATILCPLKILSPQDPTNVDFLTFPLAKSYQIISGKYYSAIPKRKFTNRK